MIYLLGIFFRFMFKSFKQFYSFLFVDTISIITCNLSFLKWHEIFHDPVLTAALTDRLTHKSHVVNMVGPSYKIKETEQWIKDNSKMTVAQF